MSISLVLKNATGALFLNEAGNSNDPAVPALQGFLSFAQDGENSNGTLRLNCIAIVQAMEGGKQGYGLLLETVAGSMTLQTSKRCETDPDYVGSFGVHSQLLVSGWNRNAEGRHYVLLNVRVNPNEHARRCASFF